MKNLLKMVLFCVATGAKQIGLLVRRWRMQLYGVPIEYGGCVHLTSIVDHRVQQRRIRQRTMEVVIAGTPRVLITAPCCAKVKRLKHGVALYPYDMTGMEIILLGEIIPSSENGQGGLVNKGQPIGSINETEIGTGVATIFSIRFSFMGKDIPPDLMIPD